MKQDLDRMFWRMIQDEKVYVDPQWMVLARHFGMPGGIWDYGVADIKEFFDSFEEADGYAKELFENTKDNLVEPMVWVLRCEKTYRKEVVVISREK